ncbi:MAG: inositol monophosphatase family protein [Acidimicrobiales bacterium]
MTQPSREELAALLALAEDLAAKAGAHLLAGLGRAAAVRTKSSATDMVSEMDRSAEAIVVGGIQRARPDDAVVGEEGSQVDGTSGVRWYVDPIDGTTNYLYGLSAFAVSIAAEVVHSGMVVGVVAAPAQGEVFTAVVGGGATLNGAPIRCSDQEDLADALVGTGFSYLPERRRAQAEVMISVLPAVRDVRRAGAASLDLCSVASGRLDGYYERGLGPWDLAAGRLIAAEAGAWVRPLDARPVPDQLVIAASPGIARSLEALAVDAGAERA